MAQFAEQVVTRLKVASWCYLQQMSGYGHSRLLVKTNTSTEMARSAGLLAKANMIVKKNHILQTCMEDVHVRECLVIHSAGHVAVILMTHPANKL
jgi:hypothetical protein